MQFHGIAQLNSNLIFMVKTLTCLFSVLGHLPVAAALSHVSLNSAIQSSFLLDGHWTGLVPLYCRTTTGHYDVPSPSPVVHRHHMTTTDHCAVPSLGDRVVLPLFLSHRGRRHVADLSARHQHLRNGGSSWPWLAEAWKKPPLSQQRFPHRSPLCCRISYCYNSYCSLSHCC